MLEFQLGIPHVNLNQYSIDPELIQLVPKELAKRANLMPIRRDRNKLLIAMADPMDYFAIEELRMATGCQIETSIAAKDDVFRTITKYYDLQESMDDALDDSDADEILRMKIKLRMKILQLFGWSIKSLRMQLHSGQVIFTLTRKKRN